ncbi:retinol dehydrogenase 12-like [Bolinopsis microptera]|uniref:retinol dehydrogenase 12-like n=1 Tax=Bolinopsis microptera TaxID=2820187 RepID=UPI003079387F
MDLSEKSVIVTGGNVGIGRPTALELARLGANVTIIGRNEATCSEAVNEIIESTGNQKVDFKIVDLASFSGIQKFADEYKATHTKLDILVNNAGVVAPPFKETEQGIEATTGINYLGHFFLTHLLKDLLISVKGRVVVVASDAYASGRITLDMMEGENPAIFKPVAKSGFQQYGLSNTCRVLFAKELIEQYPDLTCVSLHPGAVKTNIARSVGCCFQCIGKCFAPCLKSPDEGAVTTLHCATTDVSAGNGMYYKDSKIQPVKDGFVSKELQKKLWEVSMAVVEKFMSK